MATSAPCLMIGSVHSSFSGSFTVELTPGLAITGQGRQHSGKAEFDKIMVPFGAHPDQVTNLLDIAARDVYHKFFESPGIYVGSGRRLRMTWTEKERSTAGSSSS